MVKKFTASREQLKPDTRFNSLLVSKFINCLMYDGKKSVASGAFYRAMDMIVKQLPNENPVDVFLAAVDNVKPSIEVKRPDTPEPLDVDNLDDQQNEQNPQTAPTPKPVQKQTEDLQLKKALEVLADKAAAAKSGE